MMREAQDCDRLFSIKLSFLSFTRCSIHWTFSGLSQLDCQLWVVFKAMGISKNRKVRIVTFNLWGYASVEEYLALSSEYWKKINDWPKDGEAFKPPLPFDRWLVSFSREEVQNKYLCQASILASLKELLWRCPYHFEDNHWEIG